MNWTDPVHLMQAALVAGLVFAFFMGYRSGDKT